MSERTFTISISETDEDNQRLFEITDEDGEHLMEGPVVLNRNASVEVELNVKESAEASADPGDSSA